MANLIIDIGNTRTKVAVFEDGHKMAMQTADRLESIDINALAKEYPLDKAIASVVGRRSDIAAWLPAKLRERYHELSYCSQLPLRIDYQTPETLGMDRVAAAVGAWSLCPDNALAVVDAGSCITIDFVDAQGVYEGGAILPGLSFRLRALHEYTSALPLVTLAEQPEGLPLTGKSTKESIVAGVLTATMFEIQGFMEAYKSRHGAVKLFLTGGDALYFDNPYIFPNFAEPDLVLAGLDRILEMNVLD
ncbi:MAG: type III pantothenate kinase [Bacteroidales bacterium]|nr:type III pantothenate kinase [Bacteroidales bacterium]